MIIILYNCSRFRWCLQIEYDQNAGNQMDSVAFKEGFYSIELLVPIPCSRVSNWNRLVVEEQKTKRDMNVR